MFRMRTLAVQLFALALLAGCGTKQPTVVYNTFVLAPQDNLLQDCPVEPPPKRDSFIAMTKDEKIDALSGAYNQQTVNVGLCNKDKKGLRTWKAEELKRIGEKKK